MFTADRNLNSHRWPVVRLAPGTTTEIVLLSLRFFELTTHWHKCTVLCSGDGCPLCEFLPSRGLFYVACNCLSSIRMLELGSASASHLEQHCKLLHGGMKAGQIIECKRRAAKHPVHSEVVRFQENVQPVTHLSLAQHVMALYKFPPPNVTETIETYELRLQQSVQLRNERLAESILKRRPANRP